MTYKNAVAGLNLGGGKSVIIGDNRTANREMIFRAHGRFVESLGGRYITAEDVGTSTADMDFVHMETEYVTGLAGRVGRSVAGHGARRVPRDPGVGQAAVGFRRSVDGKTVAMQGVRTRGLLPRARSCTTPARKLVVTDIDAERVKRVVEEFGARGGGRSTRSTASRPTSSRPARSAAIINDETMPQLQGGDRRRRRQQPVAAEERHGDALEKRGILYAPDYVANAGGVINVYSELAGWTASGRSARPTRSTTPCSVCSRSRKARTIPTYEAADRLAEQRIKPWVGMVRTWPQWPKKS